MGRIEELNFKLKKVSDRFNSKTFITYLHSNIRVKAKYFENVKHSDEVMKMLRQDLFIKMIEYFKASGVGVLRVDEREDQRWDLYDKENGNIIGYVDYRMYAKKDNGDKKRDEIYISIHDLNNLRISKEICVAYDYKYDNYKRKWLEYKGEKQPSIYVAFTDLVEKSYNKFALIDEKIKIENVGKINEWAINNGEVIPLMEQLRVTQQDETRKRDPYVLALDTGCIGQNCLNKNLPLVISDSVVQKIKEIHGLDYDFMNDIVNKIKNNVCVFESLTQPQSLVILLEDFNKRNHPVIVICKNDVKIKNIDANVITSIYGKRDFERLLFNTYNSDRMFYKNKKTEQYFKSNHFQLVGEMKYALSNYYYKSKFCKSQMKHVKCDLMLDDKVSNIGENRRIIKAIEKQRGITYESNILETR